MRTRVAAGAALLALACVIMVACSSGGSGGRSGAKSTTTSKAKNKSFEVTTSDGTVSLSLDGRLPPGWPTTFPIPSDAKAAGSGSVGGSSRTVLVGVYTTSGSAQDAYDFYRDNSSLTVESSGSVGAGSTYVGTVKLGGAYAGNVTVTALPGSPYIIVVLDRESGSGSSSTTSSTPTSSSSS